MTVTSRGIGLLLAATALLAAGFAFGYPELTVVGTAAGAAIAFAAGYAAWRPRLEVNRSADPDRVMRGDASQVTLHVRNISRIRGATLIAYDRCGSTAVPVPLLRLRAGSATDAEYPVPTDRRGVVEIGPLRVVRRDPLGLLTLSHGHGGVSKVWVYPKVHPLTAVPAGIARSLDGKVDRVPHGSITFDTLREYVVGDELRHVHWRTTARVGELMVREHVDTSLPRLVVLLDDRQEAHPDAGRGSESDGFEAACEAAASIVMSAFREELPVTLHLVSGGAATGRATRPFLDLLAEAALHPPTATGPRRRDSLDLAIALLRHRKQGDTLIYLTGSGGAADIGRVGALRGAYPSIVAGTLGATEDSPSTLDGLLVLAATDGPDFARSWDGVRAW